MKVTLYSSGCPKCKVAAAKLNAKNIDFALVSDIDEIVKVGEEYGIKSAPILQVDDQIFSFPDAIEWIKSYQGEV